MYLIIIENCQLDKLKTVSCVEQLHSNFKRLCVFSGNQVIVLGIHYRYGSFEIIFKLCSSQVGIQSKEYSLQSENITRNFVEKIIFSFSKYIEACYPTFRFVHEMGKLYNYRESLRDVFRFELKQVFDLSLAFYTQLFTYNRSLLDLKII